MSVIGENIKKYRELRGLSQVELAEASGQTKQNIWKYENGIITNIPLSNIVAIANALHCSPCVLSGWETQKYELTDTELELLAMFNSLNDEGKEKLLSYAADLKDTGKYQKGLIASAG